jgi:hypothetical protein
VVDLARAAALLGRHVHRRAHQRAGPRPVHAAVVGRQLGDPEVEHLRALPAEHRRIAHDEDVLGLEVAVDHARGVRRPERRADHPRQPQRLDHAEPAGLAQPAVHRVALEQLHHDERAAVAVIAEVEDLHDPRIADRGDRAGLVEEPVHDLGPRAVHRQQHLDRGAPPEQRVLPEVHHAHPALPDLLDDLVAPYDLADHAVPLLTYQTSVTCHKRNRRLLRVTADAAARRRSGSSSQGA